MKRVTDTLGLARSNIAERVKGVRPKRGPQTRDGDLELAADIRRLVDARPTYGYRRIAALLKRERRANDMAPVESPESNGMAEAFVKTFKRDYVRVSPIPDANTALALIDSWMEDYNTVHPHSRLGYRSPREYILSQPAVCPP